MQVLIDEFNKQNTNGVLDWRFTLTGLLNRKFLLQVSYKFTKALILGFN